MLNISSIFLSLLILGMSSAESANFTAIAAAINALNPSGSSFQDAFNTGLAVTLPGTNIVVYLGFVVLPSQLCGITSTIEAFGCHVCSLDCLLAHNRYGGGCGVPPNPLNAKQQSKVCLCFDEPPANQTVPTAEETCGSIFNPQIDVAVDELITTFLYRREDYALCTQSLNPLGLNPLSSNPNSGCNIDCNQNHQYRNGTCTKQVPIPQTPAEAAIYNSNSPPAPEPFCACTY